MVVVAFDSKFEKTLKSFSSGLKERVKKQILKIVRNPEVGKPMRFSRKGTREVYIKPFRLSYIYFKNEDKVVFLSLYHKNEQ